MASSLAMLPNAHHASYLALLITCQIAGFGMLHGPWVACLYKP